MSDKQDEKPSGEPPTAEEMSRMIRLQLLKDAEEFDRRDAEFKELMKSAPGRPRSNDAI